MYIIATLHGRMGLHPSSFVAFYLKGLYHARRECARISLLDCMDGWGYIPCSFVAFSLKGDCTTRGEGVHSVYIIARLHGRIGLHPSSIVAFYLKGTVSREERAYTLCISLLDRMDGWGYILVAL